MVSLHVVLGYLGLRQALLRNSNDGLGSGSSGFGFRFSALNPKSSSRSPRPHEIAVLLHVSDRRSGGKRGYAAPGIKEKSACGSKNRQPVTLAPLQGYSLAWISWQDLIWFRV